MKTISYFDFKYRWIDNYSKGTFRLGQAFICMFLKQTGLEAEKSFPEYYTLWNTKDINLAEKLIYKLIDQYQWDILNLQIVQEDLL